MPEASPVLDTVVLRTLAFAHPDGVDILLQALRVAHARFPAEVYNRDEAALPLDRADEGLSELARGLRYARRQMLGKPEAEAGRYRTWLEHAAQLPRHFERGSLFVEPLALEELPRREGLVRSFGIGRGEAACLTLAERKGARAVFLSSDDAACRVARRLGIAHLTLVDVLERWVEQGRPSLQELRVLVAGLAQARFGLPGDVVARLEALVENKTHRGG